MGIPIDLRARLYILKTEVERLEAEEMRLCLAINEAVTPFLTSKEACEEALDMVPMGYNTFKIRQIMATFDKQE